MSNALIAYWSGNNIPDHLTEKIAELLIINNICKPEDLKIIYKDEKGIAETLLKDIVPFTPQAHEFTTVNREAVKNAIIYIGENFALSLVHAKKTGNLVPFMCKLIYEYRKKTDNRLMAAVEILSTKDATIPQSLIEKYNFSQNIINIIKEVYHSVK